LFWVSRTIDANGQNNDLFAADNNRQIEFKNRLENAIPKQNKITLNAVLQSKNRFDGEYLKTFAQKLIQMLSVSIQAEIDRIKPLEAQSESEYHAQHMRELSELVIGRDKEIADILRYIEDTEVKLPMILTGASGIGKSAVMAKVINYALYKEDRQILYRFCGITEKSSSMQSLMVSLLGDIGITIDVPHDMDDVKELSSWNEPKRDRVAEAISDALFSINQPTVIFIDALDQMGDRNKLEWLPSELPHNLKIIFSVLNDEKYQDDSYYFEKLTSLYPMNAFRPLGYLDNLLTAEKIITETLKQHNRKLQPHQMEYVLRQYAKVNIPFYLKIACEEIRYWDSEKTEEELNFSDNQCGIASEYIENLHKLYHHDKELVKKVFGYIFAARESMTEAQLYEILSNDRELIQRLEHIDHNNHGDMLPMAVWARLKSHIDPFVREGENGNLQFFHREFRDGARQFYSYELSQKLLNIFAILIKYKINILDVYSYLHFITLIQQKFLLPKESIMSQIILLMLIAQINSSWIEEYIKNILIESDKHEYNEIYEAINCVLKLLAEELYSCNKIKWLNLYITSINKLATSTKNYIESLKYLKKTNTITFLNRKNNPKKYIIQLGIYASFLFEYNQITESGDINQEAINFYQGLCLNDQSECLDVYIANLIGLGTSYLYADQFKEAELAFKTICNYSKGITNEQLLSAKICLSNVYFARNEHEEALNLDLKSLQTCETLYQLESDIWAETLITILQNIALSYDNIGQYHNAEKYINKCIEIIREHFDDSNRKKWESFYKNTLALKIYIIQNYENRS
jgi:hypothetical protein